MSKQYNLGLYEKSMPDSLSWKEKLLAARDAGYDYIEISIDVTPEKRHRLDWTKKERLDLICTMMETGIPIRSMCLSAHRDFPLGSHDPKREKQALEIMEKAIQFASDLGIRYIQIAGYDVYHETSDLESKQRFMKNLKRSVHMAERDGVVLGFETMETEFMNTTEKAMKYVTLIDSGYLGVYPDTGNITNAAVSYQTDVYEDLRLGKGHTIALHLKETVPGKFREIPYGTGHVDFKGLIDVAWDMGVRRYVTEFWDIGKANWKDDLVAAHDKFQTLLDQKQKEFQNV